MTTPPPGLKKAMQTLTTTIVKAERAEGAELEKLKAEIQTQLDQLLAIERAAVTDAAGHERTHDAWFEQTVARARAILG